MCRKEWGVEKKIVWKCREKNNRLWKFSVWKCRVKSPKPGLSRTSNTLLPPLPLPPLLSPQAGGNLPHPPLAPPPPSLLPPLSPHIEERACVQVRKRSLGPRTQLL